jgi:subtilisin family serine protease
MTRIHRMVAPLFLAMLVSVGAISPISTYGSETRPWGVERTRAYLAWDNDGNMTIDNVTDPRAGQGQLVAVIDFGIDYFPPSFPGDQNQYHEDLNESIGIDYFWNVGGKGFFYNTQTNQVELRDDHRDDPNGLYAGHGTHVSGTIVAVDNEIGVIGTAPKATIFMLKLITGAVQEVIAAINYAVYNTSANIINISLVINGSLPDPPGLWEACNNAYNHGKLIFAASGNDNCSVIDWPAKYNCTVAVGAVDRNLTRWVDATRIPPLGSNFGPQLNITAPGNEINSTWVNWGYKEDNGTSMACAHASGEAAMIWSSKLDRDFDQDQDGVWDAPEVLAKLYNWTLDLGQSGRDDMYGLGLVNAWATSQRPIGDINNDYRVDVKDVTACSRALYSHPGDPNWDVRCDINIDNRIDVRDYALICRQYGQRDP